MYGLFSYFPHRLHPCHHPHPPHHHPHHRRPRLQAHRAAIYIMPHQSTSVLGLFCKSTKPGRIRDLLN